MNTHCQANRPVYAVAAFYAATMQQLCKSYTKAIQKLYKKYAKAMQQL
jgi:hypothetical protein